MEGNPDSEQWLSGQLFSNPVRRDPPEWPLGEAGFGMLQESLLSKSREEQQKTRSGIYRVCFHRWSSRISSAYTREVARWLLSGIYGQFLCWWAGGRVTSQFPLSHQTLQYLSRPGRKVPWDYFTGIAARWDLNESRVREQRLFTSHKELEPKKSHKTNKQHARFEMPFFLSQAFSWLLVWGWLRDRHLASLIAFWMLSV